MRHNLNHQVSLALAKAGVDCADQVVDLYVPTCSDHGDYATSLALRLARVYKQAPQSIADTLIKKLAPLLPNLILTPLNGFINITLKPVAILGYLKQYKANTLTYPVVPQTILLEYVSANLTGPLHIGHGRWGVIGSCLSTLLKAVGHTVTTETYINNAGAQIDRFKTSIACAKSNKPLPDDGYHGNYIDDLVTADDPVQAMVDQHKQTLARAGIQFDHWFFESNLHNTDQIQTTLQSLRSRYPDLLYDADGALWLKTTAYDDDKDRVLIKSDGSLTYFAVDIAYHHAKITRGYTHVINIWGADHHGYVARMRAVMRLLAPDVPFTVCIGQLVSLSRSGQTVRMSKRSGDIIQFDDIIQEIGSDATRFFLIQKSTDSHIDIDLDLATQQTQDNPVYYIQYAHARICQVFSRLPDYAADITLASAVFESEFTASDRPLFQHLLGLQDSILAAATHYAPHHLANYSITLAKLCHRFYETNPVIRSTGNTRAYRIGVMHQIQWHLQTVCRLLGITAPTRM